MTLILLGGVICLLGMAVGTLWRLRRLFLIVTVVGPSMRPALASGDRVLVRRTGLDHIRRGAVVAVRLPPPFARPRAGGGADLALDLMVKRAVALPGDPVPAGVPGSDARVPPRHLVVLGDNPGRSHDSRTVGYVPAGAVLGVVVRRLALGQVL